MRSHTKVAVLLSLLILSSCSSDPQLKADTTEEGCVVSSVYSEDGSGSETFFDTDTSSDVVPTDTESEESTVTEIVAATEETITAEDVTTGETEDDVSGGVEFVGSVYTKAQLAALDNTLNGYGQGVRVDADNRPEGAIVMQDRYGKYDAVFIAPKSEKVYLTFDLGWENGYTGSIIDTLNAKGVKGVFFVTMDYCRSSPDIVKRIIDEGHVLGNHSVHHYSLPTLTVEQMEEEIMGLHDYIKDTYGYEMTLFRPPKGEFSERSLAVTQSLGYQTMQWSFAYLDYDVNAQPSVDHAFDRVAGAVHGGAVYLLHAVSSANDAVLGDVIDDMRLRGFVLAKYEN